MLMVNTFNYFHLLISDSNFCLVDRNTIVNPPIMHMMLLIDVLLEF